jgi:hypothetical protein
VNLFFYYQLLLLDLFFVARQREKTFVLKELLKIPVILYVISETK